MPRLEDIATGARLRGIAPHGVATIKLVEWQGDDCLDVIYLDDRGAPREAILYRHDEPNLAYVYPTPEGVARTEWSASQGEVIASVDLGAKSAEVLAARVDTDEIHELSVRFGDPGAESAFGHFVVDHVRTE